MRGYTVEMSYLMPLIVLLMVSSILGIFYYHDKNIISGAAYETAVVGSTKVRQKGGVKEDELRALFEERIKGKCILFDRVAVSVSVDRDELRIAGTGTRRGMKVSVLRRMNITDPEKKIRDIRRVKKLGDGTKDNN